MYRDPNMNCLLDIINSKEAKNDRCIKVINLITGISGEFKLINIYNSECKFEYTSKDESNALFGKYIEDKLNLIENDLVRKFLYYKFFTNSGIRKIKNILHISFETITSLEKEMYSQLCEIFCIK